VPVRDEMVTIRNAIAPRDAKNVTVVFSGA